MTEDSPPTQGASRCATTPSPAFLAAGGIDADSLDTKVKQRDKDLGSEDFFDVVNHPQVRFGADAATLDGDTLTVRGRLVRAADQR